jgi:hypothetical protein
MNKNQEMVCPVSFRKPPLSGGYVSGSNPKPDVNSGAVYNNTGYQNTSPQVQTPPQMSNAGYPGNAGDKNVHVDFEGLLSPQMSNAGYPENAGDKSAHVDFEGLLSPQMSDVGNPGNAEEIVSPQVQTPPQMPNARYYANAGCEVLSTQAMPQMSGTGVYGNEQSIYISNEVCQYAEKKIVDSQIKRYEENQKLENRMKLEDHKMSLKEGRDERMFDRKQNAELKQESAYMDVQGCMRVQHIITDGKTYVSEPVCSARYLQIQRMVSSRELPLPIYKLTFEGCEKDIYLVGKDCSPKGLIIKLQKAGCAIISAGRDKKRKTAELIYDYLMTQVRDLYCKYQYGWNKRRDGEWEFAGENELTIKRIIQGGDLYA